MRYSRSSYLILLLFSALFTYICVQEYLDVKNKQEQDILTVCTQRTENMALEALNNIRVLQSVLTLAPEDLSEENFNKIAGVMFNHAYFTFISYQPHGFVKHVYPKEGFEGTLGMDIFADEKTKKFAEQAKNTGKPVILPPYVNKDIGTLEVRYPVFETIRGKLQFWGFISVGLDMKKMFNDMVGLGALSSFDYEYALFIANDNEPISIIHSKNFEQENKQPLEVTIGDQKLILYIYNAAKDNDALLLMLIVFSACAVLSTGVYFIVHRVEQKRKVAKEAEYIDPLTNIYNRKVVDQFLEKKIHNHDGAFTLFYIYINNMAAINDKFGLEIGDKLLIAVAEKLRHNFSADTVVARIEGAEFAIIVPQFISETVVKDIMKRISSLSNKKFYIDTIRIETTSDVGFGHYPQDAQTMADILSVAESRMNENKQSAMPA